MQKEKSFNANAQPLPWWLSIIIVVGALLMAAGGLIALLHPGLLVSPGDQITQPVRIYAGYLASRNLALAIVLLIAFLLRGRAALSNLMLLIALIQILDAGIDAAEGRWIIVPGVLIFGLLYLAGAAHLRSFWKADSWS